MYVYKHHPMTSRDKEGVLIAQSIKAMVEFRKIFDTRKQECVSVKWQMILLEIGEEVFGGFLNNLTIEHVVLTKQYTKELLAMDVKEFFPSPVPAPGKVENQSNQVSAKEYSLGHPDNCRVFSMRRRKERNRHSGEKAVMDSFKKRSSLPAFA